MKKNIVKKNASVLVYTLVMLSAMSLMVQQLMQRVSNYVGFQTVAINKEKAKLLALSGVKIAIAEFLSTPVFDKDLKPVPNDPYKDDKDLLRNILPSLNNWQKFKLKESVDGIDAELKICITCEEGKININEIFDFSKGEFKKEYVRILDNLSLRVGKKLLGRGEVLKRLTNFMRSKKKPIKDISELLAIEDFSELPLFYIPQSAGGGTNVLGEIALSDIFTVWTQTDDIEPWLLSNALAQMLGLRQRSPNDSVELAERTFKDKIKKAIDGFQDDLGENWIMNWSRIEPIYGRSPMNLNEVQKIFSQQFDPEVYTVLSSAKVGETTQLLLALLEKETQQEQERFRIRKVFWL